MASGPYCEVTDDGTTYWYDSNDLQHRDGGPAVYDDHHEGWWLHGQLHRLDGPALNGGSDSAWAFYNRVVTDTADIDRYLSAPVTDRELIATLFSQGADMAEAIATAARLR